MCFVEDETFDEVESTIFNHDSRLEGTNPEESLVLSLDDRRARSVALTGGKGASLAQLKHLSRQLDDENDHHRRYQVPNGLVVSTVAFQRQLDSIGDFGRQ